MNHGKLLIADLGLSKLLAETTPNSNANKMGMVEYTDPQCFNIRNYKKDKNEPVN